jgi:hypothetical protein
MKTASQLGYPAGKFDLVPLSSVSLCRYSSKRATAGCRQSHAAYVALIPSDIAPGAHDYCPIHAAHVTPKRRFHWPFGKKPAKAQPVAP